MSLQDLANPAIIGSFYDRIERAGLGWVARLAGNKAMGGAPYRSTQETETYKFLGLTPGLRQWVGGRQTKPLWVFSQTVVNKPYELTIPVLKEELRRDKTAQIMARINGMGDAPRTHAVELISDLINAGGAATGFDGEYFFDSDHTWGNNTTNQDNDISVDISTYPAEVAGSATAPSAEEAMWVIVECIQTMLSFLDNENRPLNEGASEFDVMVAPSLAGAFAAAITKLSMNAIQGNVADAAGWKLNLIVNPWLTSATDLCYVFRADGPVSPFLFQEELTPEFDIYDDTFQNRQYLYGIETWRGADYGLWYYAVKAQMT